jgi:hypothetical protein
MRSFLRSFAASGSTRYMTGLIVCPVTRNVAGMGHRVLRLDSESIFKRPKFVVAISR